MTDQRTAPNAPTPVPGMPIWLELGTPDPGKAAAFYGTLLGWEFEDMGEEYGHYTMCYLGGRPVAAYMTTDPARNPYADGSEPGWTVYLHTDDVAATVARVPELGGTVAFEPMAAGELGTSATVVDPTGAAVGLWQPGQFPGTAIDGAPGTPCWYELTTRDLDAAGPFYAGLFDATIQPQDGPEGSRYATLHRAFDGDEWDIAGLLETPDPLPAGSGGRWGAYLGVPDADAAAATVRDLGGTVIAGPDPSAFGRVVSFVDDQGAPARLLEFAPWPED